MESKQIQVQRGNVVLTIPEIDKESYLSKGYDVLDESGAIVERSIPNDVPTLQARIEELTAENKRLKEALEAKVEKSTSAEVKELPESDKAVPASESKPTKRSRKTK